MTGCPSTNAFVSGAAQENDYHQILLSDGNSTLVFTTIVDRGKTGYDGSTWDFQLLISENGKPGNETSTQYYFFTELA